MRHSDGFDLVAIVGSQGALSVIERVLGAVDAGFPAAVVYVQHRPATAGSMLVDLLSKRLAVPVHALADGDAVRPGVVRVAPAHAQTPVSGGRFHLVHGRCAGDPLLVSAAAAYGPVRSGSCSAGA